MERISGLLVMGMLFATLTYAQDTKSVYTYKVGAAEICLLSEGQQNGRSGILIGATPQMLRQCLPNGTYPGATNAFLVRMQGKTILVDAGLGAKLFDNIRSLGIKNEQVDVILITHMHGDHIGGLLRDGKIAFPNAEMYIPQPEHDYWMNEARGQNARKIIELYKDRLHLFKPDELDAASTALLPGFKGIAAYGHTPGHTMFLLESNGEKILIWGDVAHAMAIQMPYPQVAVTYDTNPEDAVNARKKTLEYVVRNKIPIAGMHVPFPGMGNVAALSGGGYMFTGFVL